ncbi:MotE family protein [Metabacillus sp. 84]|uniref:MotE family protein n=1 Tax=Metabacillus sp. 84 TaxID=3404705 RepID=UPI003CF46FE1
MEESKKEYGWMQWFIFVISIPLAFTIALIAVILSVAGYDIGGSVMQLAGKSEETEMDVPEKSTGQKNQQKSDAAPNKDLTDEISKQKQEIKAMENDVLLKDKKIASLTKEVEDLKIQIEEAKNSKTAQKDISKLYEGMSAGKAAEILPLLSEKDAKTILSSMKDEQITGILEKMTPENAALYTEMMASFEGGE